MNSPFTPANGGVSKTRLELFDLMLKRRGLCRAPAATIQRLQSPGPCPLSFAQERVWTFEQLQPETAAYNIPMGVRLKGCLNVSALEQSLNEIVRRHEALRARFSAVEGKPVQVVSRFAPEPLRIVDLSQLSEKESESQASRLSAEEGRRVFKLNEDVLLRSLLLRLSDDEHILPLTMHHIASDAWSLFVLTCELTELYQAFSSGHSSPLAELPIQYSDYACWQRTQLQNEVLDEHLSYWTRLLRGARTTLALPTSGARPATQTFRGAKQTSLCSNSLTQAIRRLSREQGTTVFMTLFAAYAALLYRYSWQEDILIGTPIANRTRVETEGLIGFFVNTIVLRAQFSGSTTFADLLQQVRETTLGAYAHQDLPFEKLVNALQIERDPSRHPLFQAFFVFFDNPVSTTELAGLTLTPVNTYNGLSKFDLELAVMQREEDLQFIVLYNVDLFDSGAVTTFLKDYERLLEEVVARPELRLTDIPLRDEGAAGAPKVEFHNMDVFSFN